MSAVRQTAAIKRWVVEPLSPEVNKALDRLALAEDVVQLEQFSGDVNRSGFP